MATPCQQPFQRYHLPEILWFEGQHKKPDVWVSPKLPFDVHLFAVNSLPGGLQLGISGMHYLLTMSLLWLGIFQIFPLKS